MCVPIPFTKDGMINIQGCTELQKVLWSISPAFRKEMPPLEILSHYEAGMPFIREDDMSPEERAIFTYVVEKYSHGILLA